MATQTDIQCVFQLLHEPVDKKKKKRITILLKEVLLQDTTLLPNFVTVSFITILARSNFRQNNFLKFRSCLLERRLVKTFVINAKSIILKNVGDTHKNMYIIDTVHLVGIKSCLVFVNSDTLKC